MHMKYFQSLADIKDHYKDILRSFDNKQYAELLLNAWDIKLEEKELILEEKEVLRYMIGLQLELVRETNAKKPSLEVVQRCFNRHIKFLEKIYGVNDYNINKHSSKLVQKNYKACRHYLFKFSLPAWYKKLPDEILTFQNKYPNFNNKYPNFNK